MLFVARSLWTLLALVAWVAPGVCLATPASFSEFAIYGEQSVDIDRHEVFGGPIGSAGNVVVNSSEISGVYSGGNVLVNGVSNDINGDIVAMGTVYVTPNHDIYGSVHSSAPAGTLVGAEVVGPQSSSITGDVIANGDVDLENVTTLGGSVYSNGDLDAALNGTIGQDARANGSVIIGTNAAVAGDLVYGTTLTLDPGASVAGSTSQGATVVSPTTFTGISLPTPAIFSGGSGVVDEAGTSLADPLAPGTYGTLEADDIFLTGGTYVFSAIDIAKNADLYLDLSGDPIEIFVEGDVLFDGPTKTLEVLISEDGIDTDDMEDATIALASKLWLETHGTFRANRLSEWFGAVYAPYEGIDAPELSGVGALYAGGHVDGDVSEPGMKLILGSGSQTHIFVAPDYVPVPEPTTALLLALGLAGLGARSRRQGNL